MGKKEGELKPEDKGEGDAHKGGGTRGQEGGGSGKEFSVHRVRPGLDTIVSNQPLQVSFEAKGLFNVY